jgi:hypothetical protein
MIVILVAARRVKWAGWKGDASPAAVLQDALHCSVNPETLDPRPEIMTVA